jgi:hypothetical protein
VLDPDADSAPAVGLFSTEILNGKRRKTMNDRKPYRFLIPVLVLSLLPSLAAAQYTGIYTFNCNVEGCGANQPAMLAQGTDGNLYGTLPSGAGAGSWFKYNMSGLPILTNFADYTSAQVPDPLSDSNSGFTLGIDGNLYAGVSRIDGLDHGAIIRLSPSAPGQSPSGPPTMVYPFPGGTDLNGNPNPTYPVAPPIQGTDFNLYGVTKDDANTGYVYQVLLNTSTGQGTSGWSHRLPSQSSAPLLLGSDGNFYGTYSNGSFSTDSSGNMVPSANGYGGIFQITPAGVFGWYYNLNPFSTINNGNGDGNNPQGGVMQAADGYLYGTASGGGTSSTSVGGVIFKIAINGNGYSVIRPFQSADGTAPHGGLVQDRDGYLYGLTTNNGPPTSISGVPKLTMWGTLFKVSTDGTNYTVLIPFFGISQWDYIGPGTDPESTLTLHTNGVLYGLTHTGGLNSGLSGPGAYDDAGEFFSYNAGLRQFISVVGRRSAHVGDRVGIIGQGFSNPVGAATGVTFGGVAVSWTKLNATIWSDHYMTVIVPPGAKSGPVVVQETTGNLPTPYNFTITCSGLFCLHRP